MLFGLLFCILMITIYTKQGSEKYCTREKVIIWLTFKPGLALTGFQTIQRRRESKGTYMYECFRVNSLFHYLCS